MHEDPQIPNFVSAYPGPELREGMTLAIEPMITAGGPDVYLHDDEWSISTSDGSNINSFDGDGDYPTELFAQYGETSYVLFHLTQPCPVAVEEHLVLGRPQPEVLRGLRVGVEPLPLDP